jgi:hypothetical protein
MLETKKLAIEEIQIKINLFIPCETKQQGE